MSLSRVSILVAVMVSCAGLASAQAVTVQFSNGRVSVSAQNAPIRTILAEWSRVGGTRIVNAERINGAPVTLELTNVPERTALDIILRSVSGYMAGPRPVSAAGVSSYDRIMILPTSSTTTASAPAGAPVQPPRPFFGGAQPAFQPQIDPDDPEENPPNDIAPEPGESPVGPRGRPFQRGRVPPPGVVQAQPFPPLTQPDPDDQPQEGPATTPTNPFGVIPGSSRPGVVTPVPQQPRPNQRPNGDPEP
jgi:hypothetical protein